MTSHGSKVLCQLLIRTESIHSSCVAPWLSLCKQLSNLVKKITN